MVATYYGSLRLNILWLDKLVVEDQISNVNDYKKFASLKSDFDRGEMNKEKTGVPLGSYAINPVNKSKKFQFG